MKKILLVAAVLFFVFASFGQTKFGLKGGVNIAKQTASGDGGSSSSPSLTSFHGGIIIETPISAQFMFQPGLLFSQKGFDDPSGKLTLNYIELPLNFMGKFGESSTKFFIDAGPYLAYAISGNVSSGGMSDDPLGDPGYKNLDLGIGLGVGVDINGFQLSLQYEMGLMDIINWPSTMTGATMKNTNIAISVAYLFGGSE
jgi:hypothetical protein